MTGLLTACLHVLGQIHNLPPGQHGKTGIYMKRSKARDGQSVRTDSRSSHPDQSLRLPEIPALLLEDDPPVAPLPAASEPIGETPSLPVETSESEAAKLSLMVRDPHALYAHWRLMPAQQLAVAETSQPLVLNVRDESAGGPLAAQIRIGPESNHAFIPVATAGQQYVAEIGHLDRSGGWVTIACSAPVTTPHDTISEDRSAQFAEMPAALPRHVSGLWNAPAKPPEEVLEPANRSLAGLSAPPSVSWIPSLGQLCEASREKNSEVPFAMEGSEQTGFGPPIPVAGSIGKEIIGTVDFEHFVPGFAAETTAGSSFLEDRSPLPGHFLQVGTELVVHGKTQPGAVVTMAGNPIDLKSDGTFRCRFALPNGDFEMTIEAISIEGHVRRAELKIRRRTTYGE